MSAQSPSQEAEIEFSIPSGLSLDIEIGDTCLSDEENWERLVKVAVCAALEKSGKYHGQPSEIYVEIVPSGRSHELNKGYRGKDKPTNVLSFPGTEPEDLEASLILSGNGGPPTIFGDMIVADAIVVQEAGQQNKPVTHHFMHLIIHGVLHLLGYDHMDGQEAEEMESLEIEILAGLGVPNPYEVSE